MKQIKILGVLAIALTLGLAACNGGGNDGGKSQDTQTSHKHSWGEWTVTKPATCTEDGEQERSCACGEKQTKAIKAAHTWGEWETVVAATCQAEGSAKRVCSVCNAEETKTLDKADHSWGDWVTVAEADCTNAGSRKHTCSVCNTEESETVQALGHSWGDWVDVEAATCTKAGSHQHTCSRCNEVEIEAIPALGHDMQLIGDATEPEPGEAKVRVYTCANECGQTYLGFKANEVSDESKTHLVIGDDGGARFWGRPIGNDVALNDQGDPDENSHDAVFNDQQPGDFFEYVFRLDAEQVATLGEKTLLYCDATPAQWMRNNNMDFFACKPGDTDWTRGMYIDDIPETEENEKGTEIDDYRYILYVDDQPKAFDDSITNPVTSDNRGEYILPYVFKLHTGVNKISLRMAGGYRSTFYNFTFRPLVEEDPVEPEHTHTWTAGEKAADSALRPLTCTCDKTGYELQAADLTEGQKAPVSSDKNTRLGKNSLFDDVWNITGIAAGTYDLYLNAQNSSGNDNAYWNAGTAQANGDSASNNGNSTDFRYKVKVDSGEFVNIGSADDANLDQFSDFGLSNAGGAVWTNKPVAQLTIAAGAASLTIHNMDNGYSIWIYGARLIRA